MMDFIWDIEQERRIAEAKADATEARDELSRYKKRVEELEFTVNRMALASQAVWELMRSRLGISDSELLARMREIDLRDGMQDQRMTAQVTTCPKCGRTLNTKRARCIYCGTTVAKPHVFQ